MLTAGGFPFRVLEPLWKHWCMDAERLRPCFADASTARCSDRQVAKYLESIAHNCCASFVSWKNVCLLKQTVLWNLKNSIRLFQWFEFVGCQEIQPAKILLWETIDLSLENLVYYFSNSLLHMLPPAPSAYSQRFRWLHGFGQSFWQGSKRSYGTGMCANWLWISDWNAWMLARASEAGVCRGSDTPAIYVGDIDMYIP